MHFFPTPYPDEILYSTLARYCMRSGNIREIHNIEDLYETRNCIAVMELPTKLDAIIKNMPIKSKYTSEYFIYNHTLFPFYTAFLPSKRAGEIKLSMKSGEGAISYMKTGLISNSIELNKYFRLCPECFEEDIKQYGEPYWHRIHQITGAFVCPKHKRPLYNSKQLIRGGNRQRFINESYDNCIADKEIHYADNILGKMAWMAKDIETILSNCNKKILGESFVNEVRIRLVEKRYARMNNYIYQKKLRNDFIDFYGEDYLKLVQSVIPEKGETWLSYMVRDNDRTTYVLRYLLLARFLEISIEKLVDINTYSQNYEMLCVKDYQQVWDDMLRDLCDMKLSIREIAKIMNSTPKTVKKAIDRLGINKFWRYNGGGRYLDKPYIETEEFKKKRRESRKKWRELHKSQTNKSSNQIKQDNQGLHRWLTRYDIDWLRANTRRLNKTVTTVDWDKRDKELLLKVKDVVKSMRKDKPEMITWTTIGSKLGASGWLSKRRNKLPKTREYIELVVETLEEFHIRKIRWAVDELDRENRAITQWNLVDTSGVKPKYMKEIHNEIQQILNK